MKTVGNLERYVTEAVRSLDTTFERLVFLASLRDGYSGQYLHEGWVRVAPTAEIHQALRTLHQSSFESILRLPLVELTRELRFHFASVNQPERETSVLWLEAEPFRTLIPQGYSSVFRETFVSQVKTALEVLCRVPEWPQLKGPVELLRSQPDQSPLPQWLS